MADAQTLSFRLDGLEKQAARLEQLIATLPAETSAPTTATAAAASNTSTGKSSDISAAEAEIKALRTAK
eukprot:jgi/Hompol1/3690/HPOL_003329-RA